MALPSFTMRQLLEAGVHFGHNTRRWNPKMGPYLFGVRKNIHIIDLQQTVPLLHRAMVSVRDTVAAGGRVLFVGTKRQAGGKIADAAKRCGQHYVNHRWLGGMMTNWQTISNSIKRLRELDEQLIEESVGLTKKELLHLTRERDKLDRALGGIKEMGGLPDVLFVIDTLKEAIAVAEAKKLGIPVVAIVDSNSDPDDIDFPVPGNDDAIRAIGLYCDLMVGAVLDGIQAEMTSAGADVGESETAPMEHLPEAKPAEAKATTEKPEKAEADPEKPAEAKAAPEKPAEAKAAAEKPAEPEATAEKPAKAEAAPEKPVEPKAAPEKPAEAKAAAEKPAEPETAAEKPAEPEAAAEKPAEPEAAAEKPAEPEAAAEKPAETGAPAEQTGKDTKDAVPPAG